MKDESPHVTIDRLQILGKQTKDNIDKIRTMPLEEAAQAYVAFREVFDYLDLVRDEWASIKDQLSKQVIPEIFERSNVDKSITLKSGYRITVSFKMLASIKDKVAGYEWLRNNGLADIITETVNASTLSSVAKTMAEENKNLPDEYFNVVSQPTTSMTKAKR